MTRTARSAVPGEEVSPALALVNSLQAGPNGGVDQLRTPEEVTDWLRSRSLFSRPRPELKQQDVSRLAHLRSAVRELFVACAEGRLPEAHAVETANEAATATPGAPCLAWSDEGPRRSWTTTRPGTFAEALAAIAIDAIDVVCGERATTVRLCEAHGCVRLFFRRHARRRWCSTTCGDRVRAARHYRLRRIRP